MKTYNMNKCEISTYLLYLIMLLGYIYFILYIIYYAIFKTYKILSKLYRIKQIVHNNNRKLFNLILSKSTKYIVIYFIYFIY